MSSQIIHSKATLGITSLPDLVKLQCSCSACDTKACFIKNQVHQQCSCDDCSGSKTGLFFSANSKSTIDLFGDNELQIKYSKKNKKIMNEYEIDLGNQLLKMDSTLSLNDESKEKLEEIVVLNSSNLKHNIQSVSATSCRIKVTKSTAKLSAQVMNVPFKEFQKSISVPARKQETLSNMTKMSLFDLFQKIKDVYKACTCRVCECIAAKSQRNEFCNCKPCDCNDCKNSLNKQVVISHSDKELLYTSYLSPRSEKESFKKLTKSTLRQECSCIPCECIQCFDNVSELCACKPCHCIQCKPGKLHKHQTLVVAAVGDDHRTPQVCQCTPCECAQCGHGATLMTHEMSTGLNRHPRCHCDICNNEACLPDNNETCRCERQGRVMRKPVQRDSNEYDIRRAMITDNLGQIDRDRLDMIAMFASVSSRYESKCSYKKECNCNQCDCLFCKYKERSANAVKTSDIVLSNDDHNINDDDDVNFKSSISNFHTKKYNTISNLPPLKTTNDTCNYPCKCNKCDCLRCETFKQNVISYSKTKPFNNFFSKGKCRCDPCECTNCDKVMAICTGDNSGYLDCKYKKRVAKEEIYPIKKGERLTPEIHRAKMNRSLITIDDEKIECKNFEVTSINMHLPLSEGYIKKFREDISAHKHCHRDFQTHSWNNEEQLYQKLDAKTIKYAQHRETSNIVESATNTTEIEHMHLQASRTNMSDSSSISNLKDSEETVSLQSGNKHKPWESSCNSSGHDSSNYIAQFPTATAKTNLNEVTQVNDETNINVKEFDIMCKTNTVSAQLKSVNFYDNEHVKHPRGKSKLSYDECSLVQNERFQPLQINVSNQCDFNNRAFTQTENRNECWTERKSTHYGRFHDSPEILKNIYESLCNVSSVSTNTRKTAFVFLKNAFTLDDDYERVKRTLEDARGFSQQLTKMLEKYDKANREFESVSQKLRTIKNTPMFSNTSISSIKRAFLPEGGTYNATDTNSNDSIPTKDSGTNSASGGNLYSQENMSDVVDPNFTQFSKDPMSDTYKNMFEENFYDVIGSSNNDILTELKHEASKNYSSVNSSDTDDSGMSLVDDPVNDEKNLNPIAEENEPSSENISLPIKLKLKKKKSKKYNKMYRRVNILSKRFVPKMVKCSITTETSNAYVTEVKDQDTVCNNLSSPNLNRESIKSNVENGALKDENLPVVISSRAKVRILEPTLKKHNTSEDNNIVMIKPPVQSELVMHPIEMKPCPILKKNFCVKTEREAILKGYCKKPLEVKVGEAERSISRQSEYPTAGIGNVRPDNKALVNLHSEVKKLLDLPILRKIETTINDINNIANNKDLRCNSVPHCKGVFTNVSTSDVEPKAYSCDAMKVCFLTVRKVSDHTVIVRWKAPKILKNVQGYELLVDGLPVQKIFNTSRCMAVVTCLPHFDRVLLTVRTVTISPCTSGHNPSATIVYRPRSKAKI